MTSPIRISRESSFIVHLDKFDRIIGFNLSPEDIGNLAITCKTPTQEGKKNGNTCTCGVLTCKVEVVISNVPSLIIVSGDTKKDGMRSLIYYKAEQSEIEKKVNKKEDTTSCNSFTPYSNECTGSPACSQCAMVHDCYKDKCL